MNDTARELIYVVIQVMTFTIVARSLLSWFPNAQNNPVARVIFQVTEPLLAPLRRIVPRIGMIDITPMVAVILLVVIGQVILRA